MIHISQAIVVEGRYDKNTLRQIVDAPIFETHGFGVMNDKALLALLRRIAQQRGLIILTDADGAGFVIRNYLKGALPKDRVLHAYIPDIAGKERRKSAPGKEGKLGVEGMTPEILAQALLRAGAEVSEAPKGEAITKADLYAAGLNGTPDSKKRRETLKRHLNLPEHLSSNGLLEVLRVLYSREEFFSVMEEIIW